MSEDDAPAGAGAARSVPVSESASAPASGSASGPALPLRPLPSGFGLRLDPGVRRLEQGRVLVGGSPLRMLKLSTAGAGVVDRWEAGAPVGPGAGAQRLARRLLDGGLAHPVPGPGGPFTAADVTVVVPVHDDEPGLEATVAGVGEVGALVVVDDGSTHPVAPDLVPAGGRLCRRPLPGGPATARNVGLAAVATPLVAFVDADVELPADWLEPLLAHFADPAVVAVAPRVTSRSGPTVRHRFEALHSPLDLGDAPAPVAPRRAVAYVPAAVLVARVDALRAVGGFDAGLRYGEDVDLVWRLGDAGGLVRYEPAVRAAHRPRATWWRWLVQRYRYGTAAAPLEQRHPGAVPPLQVSGWSAAAWAGLAAGHPLAGAAVAATSTALLPRKLSVLAEPWPEALRLAGLGHLHAGRWIARALTRTWWPLALVGALLSRRVRRAVVAAALVPPLLDWRAARPPIGAARYVALRLADDVAYGAGVWAGCLRTGTWGPLRPDLSSWPGRRPAVEG
jgi:mycofactocin system glycosyltransferase